MDIQTDLPFAIHLETLEAGWHNILVANSLLFETNVPCATRLLASCYKEFSFVVVLYIMCTIHGVHYGKRAIVPVKNNKRYLNKKSSIDSFVSKISFCTHVICLLFMEVCI